MSVEYPGVYIEEVPGGHRPIVGASTSTLAVVGQFQKGPIAKPVYITSRNELETQLSGPQDWTPAAHALSQFFQNGGKKAWAIRIAEPRSTKPAAPEATESWIAALDALLSTSGSGPSGFQLLALPGIHALSSDTAIQKVYEHALTRCQDHRAILLVDPPNGRTPEDLPAWKPLAALRKSNAALFYPWVEVSDPTQPKTPTQLAPSGTVAGIIARTDQARGVWKAPAGLEATLTAATPTVPLTDDQQGHLNPQGLNALRTFPLHGSVVWGSRTLEPHSEWRYLPVRRLALFIESSLEQSLQWATLEPNDESLWSAIRLTVNAFLETLFRQGAFQGTSPSYAYLVRCDENTTTESERDAGLLNLDIGFAPVRPAEFLILRIQLRMADGAS